MADDPKTLQEIGTKYNISRERARQIEKQALKKMQLALPYFKPDE
jgi:RNA polymerase sigma-32 factor